MKIFDKDGNVIENYDLEKGKLKTISKNVMHTWVVDVEEEWHYEVVAEYPNGGRDVAKVIDVEEQGHWETRDEDGNLINEFDGVLSDYFPHDSATPDIWEYGEYREYTEEELANIEAQKAEAEQLAKQEAEREEKLGELIDSQEDIDLAICELYETTRTMQDEQDAAICELYEMMNGGDK